MQHRSTGERQRYRDREINLHRGMHRRHTNILEKTEMHGIVFSSHRFVNIMS